jgi:hypothetical protein
MRDKSHKISLRIGFFYFKKNPYSEYFYQLIGSTATAVEPMDLATFFRPLADEAPAYR